MKTRKFLDGMAPRHGAVVASVDALVDASVDALADTSDTSDGACPDASRREASHGTSASDSSESTPRCPAHSTGRTSAILFVWSLVVVWALFLSMDALDGSQVALFIGGTLGFSRAGGGVRERVAAVVADMEQKTVDSRQMMSLKESERLCRCGGTLRLVVEYAEVMRADGSRLSSGFDPGWVEGRLAGPLGRGRAFDSSSVGSSSGGAARYCRKEVIVKRVMYYDDDGSAEGSLVLARGALNMTGAAGVYRRVHDVVGEYPEYSYYRDGMQGHVVVVDVGGSGGRVLVSPTVGVLSDVDAIAVVAGMDGGTAESQGVLPQVHEIDAWLYGPGLGSVRGGEDVEMACMVEAKHHATRLLNLLDEARHLRFDATSAVWEALSAGVGEGGKGAFETASALRAILHSPEFGVEARMPAMHVLALMLPLGLPLVLQFVSNMKVFLKRRKR